MLDKQADQAKLTEVTVLVDTHTHRGKPCKQGDKIKLTDHDIQCLIDQQTPVIKK